MPASTAPAAGHAPLPAIIAHRGWHDGSGAGKNTIAALTAAVDGGVDAVELDVQVLGDGVPVVYHDAKVGRTPLDRLDLPALRRLEPAVPTLAEYADEAAARGASLVVELKGARGAGDAIRLVGERLPADRISSMSFVPDAVRAAKAARPDLPAGLLVYQLPATGTLGEVLMPGLPAVRARRMGADFVALSHAIAGERVLAASHRSGLAVRVWTVDAADELARLLADPRIEGVITDAPQRALQVRGATFAGIDVAEAGVRLLRAAS